MAFVYQMLGAFDEALVQYDELDALFTQFVLNSNVAGKAGLPYIKNTKKNTKKMLYRE